MTAETAGGAARQDRPLAGIGCMSVAIAFLCTMDAAVRVLVLDGLSVFQILALRSALVFVMLAAVLPFVGGVAALRTQKPWGHVLRTAFGVVAPICFFSSLKELPLADATAMFFGATFIMTGLSVPVLKERVGLHRWAAIVAGFIGVLIVTRPGAGFHAASLLVLAGSTSYALMVLIGRWMGPTESSFRQVFYFNLGLLVVSLPFLPAVWQPMAPGDVGLVGLIAVLAMGGHLLLSRAFILAPIGVVAPFDYTSLVWAAVFGYVLWQDVPVWQVVLGSAIIVASGLYILHRETVVRRRVTAAVTPAP